MNGFPAPLHRGRITASQAAVAGSILGGGGPVPTQHCEKFGSN